MNFFKSMLSEDPEPGNMDNYSKSEADHRPNHQETERAADDYTNLNSTTSGSGSGAGLWSFGDLVKTLTTRSESVLETYRRDLKEFGSGLRKESDLFREVASRAVKELPTSIEVGASAAIDGVLKSTADIVSQGKDVLLEPSDVDDSDTSESVHNSRLYSRYESQLNAIQIDVRTYCVDPEDLDDYSKWKSGFMLGDKESEIEKLIGDNGSVEAIYRKLVPNQVDDESFWCRYFYRVYKLKQQEEIRASFVRRSLTVDNEEELSWDVDDDDDDDNDEEHEETDLAQNKKNHSSDCDLKTDMSNAVKEDIEKNDDAGNRKVKPESKTDENRDCSESVGQDGCDDKDNIEEPKLSGGSAADEIVRSVSKTDEDIDCNKSCGKDMHEEDLEWDEIGDIGENDETNVLQAENVKKGELLKRLNTAEDDEDLTWDIEDDDEPAKANSCK